MDKFWWIISALVLAGSMNSTARASHEESAISPNYSTIHSYSVASKALWIVSLGSNSSIEYWLWEVQKRFPNITHANELSVSIQYHEDVIQELSDPVRDIWMSLIQKLSETSTPEILTLERRQSSLSPSEKDMLEKLRFEKNQRDLATMLLFLMENSPEELQQCRRPNI